MGANENGVAIDIQFLPLYPINEFEDIVYSVYKRIPKTDLARIFWNRPERIDLKGFLSYFDDTRLLVIAYDNEMEFCGLFWIENMAGKHRCEIGGWLPFSSRGLNAPGLMRQAIEYAHETMGFKSVFCHTPWHTAYKLCRRAGMHVVGTIENFPLHDRSVTFCILRSDRDG